MCYTFTNVKQQLSSFSGCNVPVNLHGCHMCLDTDSRSLLILKDDEMKAFLEKELCP